MHTDRPLIALVGRPNVGKSTIFNRLIGRREAITSIIPGTTRDRHFGVAKWFGNAWTIVDTAGILFEENETMLEQADLQEAMDAQVDVAIEEAALVAVVVDVKEGIHPTERQLVNVLRKHNKPMVILANKADNAAFRLQGEAFRELGVQDIFPVSGIHGSGAGEFVDYLIEHFPSPLDSTTPELPRVTIIGRPNVGKSTLINQLTGEDRMVVSSVAGTTRDSIETEVTLPDGEKFVFVDTAGIRRRGQIEAGVEKFSLFRALRAINHADIVVQVLTIEEAPARNDAHITMYAQEAGKQVILVLNKADLAINPVFKLSDKERQRLGEKFLRRFAFMQRLPFVFVSAQTGQGIKELIATLKVALNKEAK